MLSSVKFGAPRFGSEDQKALIAAAGGVSTTAGVALGSIVGLDHGVKQPEATVSTVLKDVAATAGVGAGTFGSLGLAATLCGVAVFNGVKKLLDLISPGD